MNLWWWTLVVTALFVLDQNGSTVQSFRVERHRGSFHARTLVGLHRTLVAQGGGHEAVEKTSNEQTVRLSRREFARSLELSKSPLLGPLRSSFMADGSEYSSSPSDMDMDELEAASSYARMGQSSGMGDDADDDSASTIELQPVPLSKNSGNRFVAVLWDRDLCRGNSDDVDSDDAVVERHLNRIELTEDHVSKYVILHERSRNTE
jgi:hypothetical protein